MSQLLWIAVPGGTEGGNFLLRVLIVPKLDGASLDQDGMSSWPPDELLRAKLSVDFCQAINGSVTTLEFSAPHIQPQANVWQAFFGTNMPIRVASATSGRDVNVDETSKKAANINTTFETAASVPITLDPASHAALAEVVQKELETRWSGPDISPPPPKAKASHDLPDFNRVISMLREHPTVLRALGLIFKIPVPANSVPSIFPAGFVKVRCPEATNLSIPEIVSPWTRYGNGFLPDYLTPDSSNTISAGMVAITDQDPWNAGGTGWDVVTVDVDMAARRLKDAARVLAVEATSTTAAGAAAPQPAAASLPALRSAGLTLVRTGRQGDFARRREAMERNAGDVGSAVLTADDLVLGYRIDVKPFGEDWLSLHKRKATYHVAGNGRSLTIGSADVIEEGHVKANAAVDDGNELLSADEMVVRWSGWSLAVPKPSLDGTTARSARRNLLPFNFGWEFSVPAGSLPKLQFTHSYRLRARVVDMAGGGFELRDPTANRCFTKDVAYRRYQPLSAPDVLLQDGVTKVGEGESAAELVIRSDRDLDPTSFSAQNPGYPVCLRRTILPPRSSLDVAEQHGAFDGQNDEDSFKSVQLYLDALDPNGRAENGAVFADFATGGVTVFPRREPGGLSVSMDAKAWAEPWPRLEPKWLELRDRPPRDTNVMAWEKQEGAGDTLMVRLAKAETLTLEISSFLKPDLLDHFAIRAANLSEDTIASANLGRHPLVTPSRVVRLVHAVRKPLKDPVGNLTPEPRQEGQTFTDLTPAPDLLGIDVNSTGQLDLTASWQEWRDGIIEDMTVPVQTITINRGDTAFGDKLRHDFYDTKHRRITYTTTVVSRFRHYFDLGEDHERFLGRTAMPQISIPSSARPAPPVLISTRPAFVWTEDREQDGEWSLIRKVRLGDRLRVELERPWYQTGEGEALAVILRPVSSSHDVSPYVSQIGRDPIWDTVNPERWPEAGNFDAESSVDGKLAETGETVSLVTYTPWLTQGRWFADVKFGGSPTVTSYCPLIQLALARYQRNSISGLELSTVVRSGFAPLMPDRVLTVKRAGSQVLVSLDGIGPAGPQPNRVDVIVEGFIIGGSMTTIELTRFDFPLGGLLGWSKLDVAQGLLGGTISVELPQLTLLRLRIREVEPIGSEFGVAPAELGSVSELAERVVFTDLVHLPNPT